MPQLMTRQQVADQYPITCDYLARLAQDGKKRRNGLPPAPPTIRLSAQKIVYDQAKFEAWLADPSSFTASNDEQPKRRGRPTKAAQIAARGRM